MMTMMMNDSTGVYWYRPCRNSTLQYHYIRLIPHVPPFKVIQSLNRHGLIGHALTTYFLLVSH